MSRFVQHTSLAFSPGTLTGEVASAIEVFHSEVAFQGLKRKVQQLDARDAGKGGAGMKKADVELLVADRKHQRLLKTLRETEEVLLEQLAMGKVSLASFRHVRACEAFNNKNASSLLVFFFLFFFLFFFFFFL